MAALSVDKSLLDQFWKLSDNKDANRIEAAIKILKYINFNQVKIWSTLLGSTTQEGGYRRSNASNI